MSNKTVLISKEGLAKLKKEYEHLTTVARREVAARIAEAKSYGDLRENSEYEEARNEQAKLELSIAEIKDQIDNAEIIKKSTSKNVVNIGSNIELENLTVGQKEKYEIVGSMETDVFGGKISNEPCNAVSSSEIKASSDCSISPSGTRLGNNNALPSLWRKKASINPLQARRLGRNT